jgi:integrase
MTGFRLGEAAALRWEDVGDDGSVWVTKSLTEVKGTPVEGPPKSAAGIRRIHLPKTAVAVLDRQRQWWVERFRRPPAASERVFVSLAGTPLDRHNVTRALNQLCERYGLPRIRVHDLRHLHASILATGQVPLKAIQRQLGHASVHFSLNLYTKLFVTDHAARAVDRLLSDPAGCV